MQESYFTILVSVIIAALFLIFFYLLPTVIACINKKRKWPLILLLNVLFGWTGIGWMILIVIAFTRDEMSKG